MPARLRVCENRRILRHRVFAETTEGHQTLKPQRIDLIYTIRKNMKPQLLSEFDTEMLKKRMLIETVIGDLTKLMKPRTNFLSLKTCKIFYGTHVNLLT